MNNPNESVSMALFCDFENVALGVRDTKYQKFDIRPVLERLLLKGNIVVKKAYCDWERYKEFKSPMHEANFELIEIPHVRQSGKNSADIRLVVDALDFCYTKSHVNTFVIISGDSDFSPLVSKLRENNKKVIGVGVKQSTSDLLIANCDEFIFYDDLAREGQRNAESRRDNRGAPNAGQQRRTPEDERRRKEELERRKTQAVEMVVETFDALVAERGDSGKIWASALKDALKRRRPDFNESYYGFRAFGYLLEEAQLRGFLDVGREENSSTYVYRKSADADSAIEETYASSADQHDVAQGPAAAKRGRARTRRANATTEATENLVKTETETRSQSAAAPVQKVDPAERVEQVAPLQKSDMPKRAEQVRAAQKVDVAASTEQAAPAQNVDLAKSAEPAGTAQKVALTGTVEQAGEAQRTEPKERAAKSGRATKTARADKSGRSGKTRSAKAVVSDGQSADAGADRGEQKVNVPETEAAPADIEPSPKPAKKATRSTTPRTRQARKTANPTS